MLELRCGIVAVRRASGLDNELCESSARRGKLDHSPDKWDHKSCTGGWWF